MGGGAAGADPEGKMAPSEVERAAVAKSDGAILFGLPPGGEMVGGWVGTCGRMRAQDEAGARRDCHGHAPRVPTRRRFDAERAAWAADPRKCGQWAEGLGGGKERREEKT